MNLKSTKKRRKLVWELSAGDDKNLIRKLKEKSKLMVH